MRQIFLKLSASSELSARSLLSLLRLSSEHLPRTPQHKPYAHSRRHAHQAIQRSSLNTNQPRPEPLSRQRTVSDPAANRLRRDRHGFSGSVEGDVLRGHCCCSPTGFEHGDAQVSVWGALLPRRAAVPACRFVLALALVSTSVHVPSDNDPTAGFRRSKHRARARQVPAKRRGRDSTAPTVCPGHATKQRHAGTVHSGSVCRVPHRPIRLRVKRAWMLMTGLYRYPVDLPARKIMAANLAQATFIGAWLTVQSRLVGTSKSVAEWSLVGALLLVLMWPLLTAIPGIAWSFCQFIRVRRELRRENGGRSRR